MPSGRTHDSITLWSLPLVSGLSFVCTGNSGFTLLVSGGFLFSGLMFGPDLDIHSRQYLRWGAVRWIWLPYRRSLRHRSLWSHGLLVGTLIRVVYLLACFGLLGLLLVILGSMFSLGLGREADWNEMIRSNSVTGLNFLSHSLQTYPLEWLALGLGLELGALSHSLSDWLGSAWKRRAKGK